MSNFEIVIRSRLSDWDLYSVADGWTDCDRDRPREEAECRSACGFSQLANSATESPAEAGSPDCPSAKASGKYKENPAAKIVNGVAHCGLAKTRPPATRSSNP